MITHEFWRHSATGEVWAVRLRDGVVVARAGPLHRDDARPEYLDSLDYTAEGAEAVESAREEYMLLTDV
jgi:hypothetical protein